MNVLRERLTDTVTLRFLPVDSPEARALGVERAPALVVNGRKIQYGVPTPEEIVALLEETGPQKIGVILTKSPWAGDDAAKALLTVRAALEDGNAAALFLLSDGVLAARVGNSLAGEIAGFLADGGEVLASEEHLRAAGTGLESLLPGVEVVNDPYDALVDVVLGNWDRVVVF